MALIALSVSRIQSEIPAYIFIGDDSIFSVAFSNGTVPQRTASRYRLSLNMGRRLHRNDTRFAARVTGQINVIGVSSGQLTAHYFGRWLVIGIADLIWQHFRLRVRRAFDSGVRQPRGFHVWLRRASFTFHAAFFISLFLRRADGKAYFMPRFPAYAACWLTARR